MDVLALVEGDRPARDPSAFGGDPTDAFDVIAPSLPGFGFPGPLTGFPDVSFWQVADLWHTLMTDTLGHESMPSAAAASAGSSPASSATSTRLTDDQPADIRARTIELDHRRAPHLAVHMLDGATLAHALSDSHPPASSPGS